MAKEKQVFFCQECGFESTKWMGQCPGCKAWNSFCEEKVTVGAKSQSGRRTVVAPTSILEVEKTDEWFTGACGRRSRNRQVHHIAADVQKHVRDGTEDTVCVG